MTYKRKGTQRTEPQEQKTQSHRQNLEHKVDIRAYVQQELHVSYVLKRARKKTEKGQIICNANIETEQAQRDQHSSGKTQGAISLTFNTPKHRRTTTVGDNQR